MVIYCYLTIPTKQISMKLTPNGLDCWESIWAAYDETTYQTALSYIQPRDIVLDIGAGDLRLARRAANMARHVYAIEIQPTLLVDQPPLPPNLTIIQGDARYIDWPHGITLGVLLMRHCTHLSLYAARLRASGCSRLITNSRWGMDVELMSLRPQATWPSVEIGWYACLCGQTGFIAGLPEKLTEADIWRVTEVENCPDCLGQVNSN